LASGPTAHAEPLTETRRRSLVKSLSWRFFATLITMTVAFGITGKVDFAIEIGLLDTTIKFVTYYAHERAWLRIDYGRPKKPPDYQI
jgi:adenylylsulfate kinase